MLIEPIGNSRITDHKEDWKKDHSHMNEMLKLSCNLHKDPDGRVLALVMSCKDAIDIMVSLLQRSTTTSK